VKEAEMDLDEGRKLHAVPSATHRTLDDLAALGARELARLYGDARCPGADELDGPLEGRLLSAPLVGRLPSPLRALFASRAMPWRGKRFRSRDAAGGEGVNQFWGGAGAVRFATSVGRSRADERDALRLDYDRPGNPLLIRRVHDELRAVAPGLFLGRMYFLLGGRATFVLFFALASR
jgi:hypothetical protein